MGRSKGQGLNNRQLRGYYVILPDLSDIEDKIMSGEELTESDTDLFKAKNIIFIKLEDNAEDLGDEYIELTTEEKRRIPISTEHIAFVRLKLH